MAFSICCANASDRFCHMPVSEGKVRHCSSSQAHGGQGALQAGVDRPVIALWLGEDGVDKDALHSGEVRPDDRLESWIGYRSRSKRIRDIHSVDYLYPNNEFTNVGACY